jgi:hypothetical protein
MAGERATTIRFSDSIYQRLEAAGELTGLPINSIVVVACLEWLDAHQPEPGATVAMGPLAGISYTQQMRTFPKNLLPPGLRKGTNPFDRFSVRAKQALLVAQEQAEKRGQGSIDPEDLLLGLLRVEGGFAATVLPRFGIDTATVESQMAIPVEKSTIQRLVPMSRTKRVIESAFGLARGWQHRCVGTGHLLVGLVTQADGVVAIVFKEKGVTVDTLNPEINRLRGTVGPED